MRTHHRVAWALATLVMLLPTGGISAADTPSPVTVSVTDTWPQGDDITLGRNHNFYLRLAYRSTTPVGIWIRPYFHGEPAKVGSSPSMRYSGDGEALVDWTLRAYENDPTLKPNALIVYGPFLDGERRAAFDQRVAALEPRVSAVGFDSRIESLMANAQGIVAMGGYNTFCEILSFDKRALIVPRTRPRMEQYLRATRAKEFGLVSMLEDPEETGSGTRDPGVMAEALRQLADQPRPSLSRMPGLLDGLPRIRAHLDPLMQPGESLPVAPLRAGL